MKSCPMHAFHSDYTTPRKKFQPRKSVKWNQQRLTVLAAEGKILALEIAAGIAEGNGFGGENFAQIRFQHQ